MASLAKAEELFSNRRWRLDNLYTIRDERGHSIPFRLNNIQGQLLDNLWTLNLILKARQMGCTTFLQILMLDACLFNSNTSAGIVAHNREDAEAFFDDKIKFAYDNLDPEIKRTITAEQDSAKSLTFSNGSRIRVGTSLRSGTFQYLHVCVAGDTLIWTKEARMKRIDEIEAGEKVMTERGSYATVKEVIQNRLSDLGFRLLSVKAFGYYEPLRITENHRVLTRTKATGAPVWKEAGEVRAGDYLAIPTREPSLKVKNGLPFGQERIEPNFNLGWVAGLYLAEGTIRERNGNPPTEVLFSVHRKEVARALAAIDGLAQHLGERRQGSKVVRVYDHKSLTSVVAVNSKSLASFLATSFGFGADKHIPDKIWGWGSPFMHGLLKGYLDGDGSQSDPQRISVSSIRRQLLDQLRMVMVSLRFGVPSLYHAEAGEKHGRNCKEQWTLKLSGPGNWKYREKHGLPLPEVNTWSGKWRIAHGTRPDGRKHWRRGTAHYWMRVTEVEEIAPVQFVYDLVLDTEPHSYMTANGIVHNSEFGKVCAQFPSKAKEIVTGAFNTVHAGQFIAVESTAEGQGGYFHDMVMAAKRHAEQNLPLTPLDFKLHFFPWFDDPKYALSDQDTNRVILTSEHERYFDALDDRGISLSPNQEAWYVKKSNTMQDDMKREFPATVEEAFEASIEGAFYSTEMGRVRKEGRICRIPVERGPVDTFWDLGVNDDMVIWFRQRVGPEHRFIDYYANSGEGFDHYFRILKEKGDERNWTYGAHHMPHDAEQRRLGREAKTARELAIEAGIRPIIVVGRIPSEKVGVEAVRSYLRKCWFDEVHCSEGLWCLDNYRKEWDEDRGVWKDKPRHDKASHGAKALETAAVHRDFDEEPEDGYVGDDGRSKVSGY